MTGRLLALGGRLSGVPKMQFLRYDIPLVGGEFLGGFNNQQ